MNITKFGLQNFRVFKEHFEFDLAPIMVLTGPNNSGKSSLSKALLLLKANEDKINADMHSLVKLNYFEGLHDLGNHELTINKIGEHTYFSFTFFLGYKFYIEIDNEGEFIWDYIITTKDDKIIMCQSGCLIKIGVENIIAYFKDRVFFGERKYLYSFPGHDSETLSTNSDWKNVKEFISRLEDFGKEIHFIDVDLMDTSYIEGKFAEEQPTFEENLKRGIFSPPFFEDDPEFDRQDFNWQENLIFLFYKITSIKLTTDEIHFLIPTSANEYETTKGFFQFSDVVYVNSIKESFKRAYSKNDVSAFQSLIINEITKDINTVYGNNYDHRYRINVLEKTENIPLSSFFHTNESHVLFTKKWLKEFEIGEELFYGYDKGNDIYFIKVDNKSLPEYGLGYGLIIHILLALSNEIHKYRGKEEREDLKLHFPATYIIEEPETGLHPAFQSKMAEMIVDIQKTFNVKLIIETHSEYFIRKLQYLTATNEINPGDAVIYYFNNPKKIPQGEKQIKKITIEKDGSLTDNFGPGFIDEGTSLKFELMRLNKGRQN
jgi:energy-coupling factor transporter ATP-binding protein EcfA2